MYADDLAILSIHKNQKSAVGNLQVESHMFLLWAHDKELTINVKKTEIRHVTSPNIPREGIIKILSHNLDFIHTQNANTLW